MTAREKKAAKHVCAPFRYCVCSIVADEPNEDCPIHGSEPWPRCRCGRFVPRAAKEK